MQTVKKLGLSSKYKLTSDSNITILNSFALAPYLHQGARMSEEGPTRDQNGLRDPHRLLSPT